MLRWWIVLPWSVLTLGAVLFIAFEATFRGQAIDFDTHQPVPRLRVELNVSGALNFFSSYQYEGVTDDSGRFSVISFHNNKGQLSILGGQNFAPIQTEIRAGKPRIILVKSIVTKSTLGMFHSWVGIKNGRPFGWNFERNSPALNAEEADIFPKLPDESPETRKLTLSANPRGSIAFVDASAYGLHDFTGFTLLFYADTVPEALWKSEVTCDLMNANGWVFIKTAEGNYAKIVCNSRSFITSQSPSSDTDWATGLQTVFNPSSGHSVSYTGDIRFSDAAYSPFANYMSPR